MKCFIVLYSASLFWSSAVSEPCQTPLGRVSNCVVLYECPTLAAIVYIQNPKPRELVSFLQLSQCGFDGNVPKVCCGPAPHQKNATTQRTQVSARPSFNGTKDPVFPEDSNPAPRSECGIDEDPNRIYNGEIDTELDEFPWLALLGYQPKDASKPLTYQCGGVLVNHRYVLSAAHCVVGEIENVVGKLTTVRLGEHDTKNGTDCLYELCADPIQEIAVESVHPHLGYSDQNTNRQDDIALIRLAKRVEYNIDFIQPICLVGNDQRLDAGMNMFVAGWGKTLHGKSSTIKQKLALPIFSKGDCVAKYRGLGVEITDKQLCAGGNFAQDACTGDSGGPLMRLTDSGYWEVVAVDSFGYGCGRDGQPAIYTSVQGYLDWIKNTLRLSNV